MNADELRAHTLRINDGTFHDGVVRPRPRRDRTMDPSAGSTMRGSEASRERGADGEAAREADAPVVAHVLARSGLDRAPEARRKRAVETEGRGASLAIGEHVADKEGGVFAEGPRGLGCFAQRSQRCPVATLEVRSLWGDTAAGPRQRVCDALRFQLVT